MLEIYTIIENINVELRFYNAIHDDGFKYSLWINFLEKAQSLSSIYFLAYILMVYKWDGSMDRSNKREDTQMVKNKGTNTLKNFLKYNYSILKSA